MELNPFGRCTVKIATRSTTTIGTAATGTKAPKRTSNPQDLYPNRGPAKQVGKRHTDGMQYGYKSVGPVGEFRVAGLDEAKSAAAHTSCPELAVVKWRHWKESAFVILNDQTISARGLLQITLRILPRRSAYARLVTLYR